MRKAEYWHHDDRRRCVCDLCPHRCVISPGQSGKCRSRRNIDGALYTMVYGRPCSIAVDPVEKKPLNEWMEGTYCLSIACTGCNLRCLNCQNYQISQAAPEDTESEYNVSPSMLVDYCVAHHLPSIAYTYTEPLTYMEYIRDIALEAHRRGIKNILVTAGYVNSEPLADLLPLLDAANIDIKAMSDDVYRHQCGAALDPVLTAVKAMRNAGIWLELTNLVIPGVNDDDVLLRRLCRWIADNGLSAQPLHFSRFFPRYKMRDTMPTPVATLRKAKKIAEQEGLLSVYLGNI